MSEFMSETFATLTNGDIYAVWPEGLIRPFLTEKGVLDNSAAVPFI